MENLGELLGSVPGWGAPSCVGFAYSHPSLFLPGAPVSPSTLTKKTCQYPVGDEDLDVVPTAPLRKRMAQVQRTHFF